MVVVTSAHVLHIGKTLVVWAFLVRPLHWRASRLPFCVSSIRGTLPFDVAALFERYGPVVRIAPNELAYVEAQAWRDICGHSPKTEENGKFTEFYRPGKGMPQDIISADKKTHTVIRRQLSHGFGDRAIRDQEPIIRGYVDLLMDRLHEHGQEGHHALDMTAWYNYTTFDVIGDLAFGDSFGCLQEASMHYWVKTFFKLTELSVWMQSAIHYPLIKDLLINSIPKSFMKVLDDNAEFAHRKVSKRIELGASRNDLIEGLLMKQDDWQMPRQDIDSHAGLLIVAGSETTATLLSGATYLLASHPEALAKLTREVRSAFTSEDQITVASAGQLTYMLACLDEAFRMYPPVPTGLPRIVAPGGRMICGEFMPGGTHVGVWQWAANHYSANWAKPFEYHPERWIDGQNAEFAADQREAMQPFSYGPRNCIGRNLAYAEMRTIIARLVFAFDLKLAPEGENWLRGQKVFNLWRKPPLWVHLVPRA
ncbi:cytochrome P450 [Cryphonectria parasitica EP155]|uniref:Cytochrome P450 n=1 Tax=Cryphonectria parasitica (strain ATCC 38755 / EP155) TaxID=660469 RepID=A0A9P4XYZ8_CRYP1|nr:cytochrome P450 [Cryphonectria parasitica EP155]KAF3763603.1 cytochrome P450 [Cryphonectria parasitica EP155]